MKIDKPKQFIFRSIELEIEHIISNSIVFTRDDQINWNNLSFEASQQNILLYDYKTKMLYYNGNIFIPIYESELISKLELHLLIKQIVLNYFDIEINGVF